jgi:uncharacterized protein
VIFVDTSFLFALVSEKDAHHQRVLAVAKDLLAVPLSEQLITTNHVVAETITLTRGLGHDSAVRLGERLYSERIARIHWATPDEEAAAFAYFRKYADKEYSFVDCLSFVIMEKLNLKEALAVDSDFTHRFVAIPGPRQR